MRHKGQQNEGQKNRAAGAPSDWPEARSEPVGPGRSGHDDGRAANLRLSTQVRVGTKVFAVTTFSQRTRVTFSLTGSVHGSSDLTSTNPAPQRVENAYDSFF